MELFSPIVNKYSYRASFISACHPNAVFVLEKFQVLFYVIGKHSMQKIMLRLLTESYGGKMFILFLFLCSYLHLNVFHYVNHSRHKDNNKYYKVKDDFFVSMHTSSKKRQDTE